MSEPSECAALIREAGRHFRATPIDEHQRRGDQVRRVLLFGRGGHPLLALTFIRSPGQSPRVIAATSADWGGATGTSIEALLSPREWEEVMDRSSHFHRALAPEPDSSGRITVCGDGAPVVAEASDPRKPGQHADTPLRQRAEHDCFGLTEAFEQWAGEFALARFPECAWLRVRGLAAYILSACARFSGDKVAAAEVYHQVRDWPKLAEPEHLARFREQFTSGATLTWAGEAIAGGAAEAWLARTREGEGAAYFHHSAHGESAHRVRTRGFLQGWVRSGGEGESWSAPVEMIWEADGGGYRVRRVEVGAFTRSKRAVCPLNIRRLNNDPNCR